MSKIQTIAARRMPAAGLGFLGVSSGSHLPGETFLLGQFTHYNERIAPSVVPMDFVDLAVRMRFMGAPSDTVFDLTMRLEETPNNQSVCPYGATNNNECDDRVDFTNNTPQTVVNIDGVDYALEMVGFVPGTIGQCQPSDQVQDFFITAERTRNDACVYARFIEPAPSITIEKTPDLQQIAPGGDIEFSIKVHNTGNVGLAEVNVDDPMAPECSLAIGDLKAGVEMSYTCTVYGAYEAYENVATVTGLFAGQTYQASDNAIVEMLAIDLPTVRALKYHDGNGNGVQDLDEPGLPGWEICLADGAGTESCKITDDNGYVELAAPDSGDYQICETLQPGWENTDPSDGSLCKPVTLVRGSNDIELPVTVADVYRIIYEDRSPDNMYWTYRAGQYIGAEPMTQWVLALGPCLDASQIDATWTTPGWTLVDGTEAGGPGLRGIRWETPGGVALEGDVFFLALKTGFPTGATTAGVVSASGGATTAEIAGPVCTSPVAIGNKESAAVTTGLEVRVAVAPTTDSGRFDLQVDGVTLADDVAHGGTTGLQLIAAGTHNIAQLAGADTALDDYVTDVSCQVIGGGTWKPDASGNVLIQSGETVVCTYSNIRKGEVVIAKTITGGGAAEAQFTGSFGQFSVAGGSEKHFERLAPGSYNVFETLQPTWWLAALTCSDPDNGTATDMASAAVAIDLDPGEVVRCTFENSRESGVITIVKQVTAPADSDWLFNGGALGDFSLPAAGGQRSFTEVPPGVYTIAEAPRANWYVNSLVCTDPDGETAVFGPTGFATVDVDTGEEITCTFVNSPGTPDITLDKSVKQPIQYVGDVAEFTFVVGAKTPVPLNNVIVEDLMCTVAPVLNGRINVGDANTNGWLDMGEQWQYTCSAPLIEDTVNSGDCHRYNPVGQLGVCHGHRTGGRDRTGTGGQQGGQPGNRVCRPNGDVHNRGHEQRGLTACQRCGGGIHS
ncbi:MAG: choice-of-anchor K domain-containing protein [Anaerolineales bacterium]|nr:choice-of-anchor K domain-containing protein [Anaerolineales bacterium]